MQPRWLISLQPWLRALKTDCRNQRPHFHQTWIAIPDFSIHVAIKTGESCEFCLEQCSAHIRKPTNPPAMSFSQPSPLSSPLSSHPTETSLLTFPIEIRSLIYDNLLSGPDRYIISSSDRHRFHQKFADKNIPKSQGAYAFPATNLLVVSRQLRSEIQPVIIEMACLYCSVADFYDGAYCTRQLPAWLRTSLKHFSIYQSYVPPNSDFRGALARFNLNTRARTGTRRGGVNSHGGDEDEGDGNLTPGWRERRRVENLQQLMSVTSPRHPRPRYVRRGKFLKALPALESVNVVYFPPEIPGRFKARLEDFYDGRRDDQLLSLIKTALEDELLYDNFIASLLVSGQTKGLDPDDIPEAILDGSVQRRVLNLTSRELPANRVSISVTAHFREMYPAKEEERRCLVNGFLPLLPFALMGCDRARLAH